MNTLLTTLLLALYGLSISGQSTSVQVDVDIDTQMILDGTISYSSVQGNTVLRINKHSAGVNEDTQAILEIKKITSQGTPLAYTESDQWIIIDPSDNKREDISIDYSIDLKKMMDWRKAYGYATFPSTYKDKCWYPDLYLNSDRDFSKIFHVSVTHPANLTLMTSGKLISRDSTGTNHISEYVAKDVRYFGLNAGEEYVVRTIAHDDLSLSYFCSIDRAEEYHNVATTALDAMKWYRDEYGFFPKTHINIAMGHPRWHGGFPSENMFYIHQGNLQKDFVQWITAHEIGHYYWGLHALSATDDELSPLMLANGIWIDHFYLSKAYQLSLADIWTTETPQAAMMEKYLATCLANYEQGIGYTSAEQDFDFDYNSNIAHGKAAIGIYLLSQLIGPEEYLHLQKELLGKYANKPLSITDFTLFLEEKGYHFANKLLSSWYADHSSIEYLIRKFHIEQTENGWNYTLDVRRIGTVDFPIDIVVIDEEGNKYSHITTASKKQEIINGVSSAKPSEYLLDPHGKVPMWNSDNQNIQDVYVSALYRAGKVKLANQLVDQDVSRYKHNISIMKWYNRYNK